MVGDQTTSGTPIANAIVSVKFVMTGDIRKDTSGTDGKYKFDSLIVGEYHITTTVANFFSKTEPSGLDTVNTSWA